MRIRFMHPDELERVIARAIETAVGQVVPRERPGATRAGIATQLAQMYYKVLQMPGGAVLVADVDHLGLDDGPAAHALLMPQNNSFTSEPELVIMDIYTHPKVRGQGVARMLLEQSRAYGVRTGCRSLVAQVALHNLASLSLFRAAGYREERLILGFRG